MRLDQAYAMDNSWDCLIERIRNMDEISEDHRNRLVRSVTALRDNLGKDWWPPAGHPLLFDIQNTINTHADWLVSRLANDITSMKSAGIGGIVKRIRDPAEYFGAAAELEVGGALARFGYELTIGPEVGKKQPDFLCKKNGVEFLAEVKMLGTSEKYRDAARTSGQIMATCHPIFPVGTITRSLPSHELVGVERTLKDAVNRVSVGSPQKVDIPDTLKLYLVHPDDPDKVSMYDKWCRAPENSDIPDSGGLSGPPVDRTDLVRIKIKIIRFLKSQQIPKERMGVLFITGHFMIQDADVKAVVADLLEHVNELPHVPAVVLIAIRTFTLSPNLPRIKEEDDYIDIDYRLAPYTKERVLIIKNRSCQFSFDYSILADMYAKRNKFVYR